MLEQSRDRQLSFCEKREARPGCQELSNFSFVLVEMFLKRSVNSPGAGGPGVGGSLLAGGLLPLNKPKWVVDSSHCFSASPSAGASADAVK